MGNKIKFLFKDAIVLMAITLVSGFLLALVFEVTKEPIAKAAYEKKMAAYKKVFEGAKEFKEDEKTKALTEGALEAIKKDGASLGKVGFEEVMTAVDDNGKEKGYVATVYSDEGYGGRIRISFGYDVEKKLLTKIEILEASETAGLGAKISTPEFSGQYSNKGVKAFKVKKGSASTDDEIAAISGATISSTAVTNAINAGLLVLEGGTK